jgi:2-succinyl-6-hydroxy-2,4-cyclohexadiene-1-carboxylate synthase
VVLIHGFMGSVAAWGELPGRLARERTVLVPDLPGHGGSEKPLDPEAYAVAGVAAALAQVVSAIEGASADWIGYSMGGRILLAGVAEGHIRPRRLVLESSSPGLVDSAARVRRRGLDGARADALERDGLEAFVASWMELPLFATQARLPATLRREQVLRRLQNDPAALAACLRGGGTGSQRSYWEALPTIVAPTTLLTGGADQKFATIADRMVTMLPDGRHDRVSGAGHAVHMERPEAWLAAVRTALEIAN